MNEKKIYCIICSDCNGEGKVPNQENKRFPAPLLPGESLIFGRERPLITPTKIVCEKCQGRGWIPDKEIEDE